MGLFNRKKKEVKAATVEVPAIPHEHTWKDMPWYMTEYYMPAEKTAGYRITEPYICITCGKRENVKLEEIEWKNISVEEREKEYQRIRNRYKTYLKPRAIVEDMINNILLVKDPNHLDMVEEMRGTPHRGCGTSSTMKTNTDKFKVGGK